METRECPFCGSRSKHCADTGDHWILCTECRTTSGTHRSEEEAIAAWNTRTRPDKARVEALVQTMLWKYRLHMQNPSDKKVVMEFDDAKAALLAMLPGERKERIFTGASFDDGDRPPIDSDDK